MLLGVHASSNIMNACFTRSCVNDGIIRTRYLHPHLRQCLALPFQYLHHYVVANYVVDLRHRYLVVLLSSSALNQPDRLRNVTNVTFIERDRTTSLDCTILQIKHLVTLSVSCISQQQRSEILSRRIFFVHFESSIWADASEPNTRR